MGQRQSSSEWMINIGLSIWCARRTGRGARTPRASSMWSTPCSDLNAVEMSDDHSSDVRLLTARSEQNAREAVAVLGGQPRRHEPAVGTAEHADAVAVAELVPIEGGVDDRQDVVDIDAAPTGPRARRGGSGPRIACPHPSWRPLPPRGLPSTTTNPAVACAWNSSKKVSPYWVCGPPCTLRSTGYRSEGSKSAGRMIHASISSLPSVVGTANRSHANGARRERVGDERSSLVTDEQFGRTPGIRSSGGDRRRGRVHAVQRDRAFGESFGRHGTRRGDAVQVRLAAVLGARQQGSIGLPHRRRAAGGRVERAIEIGRAPVDLVGRRRVRADGDDADLAVLRVGRRVAVADERDPGAVGRHGGRAVVARRASSAADLAVAVGRAEHHDVEVVGQVAVPGVVALAGR